MKSLGSFLRIERTRPMNDWRRLIGSEVKIGCSREGWSHVLYHTRQKGRLGMGWKESGGRRHDLQNYRWEMYQGRMDRTVLNLRQYWMLIGQTFSLTVKLLRIWTWWFRSISCPSNSMAPAHCLVQNDSRFNSDLWKYEKHHFENHIGTITYEPFCVFSI